MPTRQPLAAALVAISLVAAVIVVSPCAAGAGPGGRRAVPAPANLALVATATTSFVSGHETIQALNSGYPPELQRQAARGLRQLAAEGHAVGRVRLEPADPHRQDRRLLVRRPRRRPPAQGMPLKYFDGEQFVPVKNANGLGPGGEPLQHHDFRRRPAPRGSAWRWIPAANRPAFSSGGCIDSGDSPDFPPRGRRGPRSGRRAAGQDMAQRQRPRRRQAGPQSPGDLEQAVRARAT